MMSFLAFCAALAVCASPAVRAQGGDRGEWHGVSLGFQLGLDVVVPTAASSDLPVLRVTLRNATDEALVVRETFPESDYSIWIFDAEGTPVEPVRDCGRVWRSLDVPVEPGAAIAHRYRLGKLYDPPPDGRYLVFATRSVYRLDGEGLGQVQSDPLGLAVSHSEWTAVSLTPAERQAAVRHAAAIAAPRCGSVSPRLVAARSLLERHGFRVSWDATQRRLVARYKDLSATLADGKDVMVVGERQVRMGRPAQVVAGQFRAPGQALSVIAALAGRAASQTVAVGAG